MKVILVRDEASVVKNIQNYLDKIGAWYFNVWGGSAFQDSGVPDIIACYKGCFIGIEAKDEKGVPSTLQIITGLNIKKAKGKFVIAKDVKSVAKIIKEIDERG